MKSTQGLLGSLLIGLGICIPAASAPLDAFLSANQINTPGEGELELSYDFVNSSVDFLGVRDKNNSSSTVGDYKGAHLRGGVAITPRLWIDGALWRREVDYRSFVADLTTWQIAGQYKVLDGARVAPSVALRFGAWGNYSDALTKSTNTTIAGTKFTSATVTKPKDSQYQLDLIGTWPVSQRVELSAFAGAGVSNITNDSVSATSRSSNGCEYNVAFVDAGSVSTLAQPCSASVVVSRFAQPSSATVDVNREAKYTASFYQLGVLAVWSNDVWRLRGGYQFQNINRKNVDNIIASRGTASYKNNQILMADISYKAMKNTVIFLRGQYMSNQFNGEIPLAYNSLTADRFGQRYGVVSAGLIYQF